MKGGQRLVSWSVFVIIFFHLARTFPQVSHSLTGAFARLIRQASRNSALQRGASPGGGKTKWPQRLWRLWRCPSKNNPISLSAPPRRCRRGFPWISLILECLRLICHAQRYVRANHIMESHLSSEGVGVEAGIPSRFLAPTPTHNRSYLYRYSWRTGLHLSRGCSWCSAEWVVGGWRVRGWMRSS